MKHNELLPRLPEIGEFVRSHGKLISIENIPPPPTPPPQKDYIFEETTAQIELRFNQKTIQIIDSMNDFYGHETSVESAINGAKKFAEENHIGLSSELEVVAIKKLNQTRMRPVSKSNFYDKKYFDFKSLDYGSKRDLPDEAEMIVWSSRNLD